MNTIFNSTHPGHSSHATDHCPMCGLPTHRELDWAFSHEAENQPAWLLARLLARGIDYTMVTILAVVFNLLTFGSFFKGLEWFEAGLRSSQEVIAVLMLFVLTMGYFIVFHLLHGQTLGKRVLRIQVRPHANSRTASHPGVISNLVRELIVLFCFSTGGWLFLLPILSSRRRALHDLLSGTAVIEQPDEPLV